MNPTNVCLASAGLFFATGLATGTWKYVCIVRSPRARAPFYVDTAHRASLMYAFASVLLAELCARSVWSDATNLAAVVVLELFFAAAVLGYIAHGVLGDTDNQLERPHRLGKRTIPAGVMLAFMVSLVLGKLGGFLVLFAGYLASLA